MIMFRENQSMEAFKQPDLEVGLGVIASIERLFDERQVNGRKGQILRWNTNQTL